MNLDLEGGGFRGVNGPIHPRPTFALRAQAARLSVSMFSWESNGRFSARWLDRVRSVGVETMMSSHSLVFLSLLRLSSSLRAAGRPREALVLLEKSLESLESDGLAMAYRELIYAGLESGDRSKAAAFARKLHEVDPANPLASPFLGDR